MQKISRFYAVIIINFLLIFSTSFAQQVFEVDLNNRADDKFHLTVYPEKLSADNNIFQFAATAPGTYQTMDIGRFVSDFKAYDKSGNVISTENSSTNQWTISNPSAVYKITYNVADIWDTPVKEHRLYPMCSSTISDDFVMINGQAVFGYFKGMQSEPIKIKIDYPSDWSIGTPLKKDANGYYDADTFDKVVDSPFYLGNLTKTTTEVGGANIDVYTHSINGSITSDDILDMLKDILNAESDFTEGLPVKDYTFLFYFGKFDAGAWEHSYSSEYVSREDSLTDRFKAEIKSVVAHEFFHVNTPLNIHSELVEKFNFVKPVMSQHLWLYEGVTEWAAHILQLRDNLITLDAYLNELHNKLAFNDNFDQSVSLTDLGVHATEMPDQYPNIYMKGAVVGGLLDIRLLKLSNGKKGLRELLIELSKKYGPKHSFSEDNFFDELASMTYPAIGDFINKYIKGTEKLPVKEYYNWLGIDYKEIGGYDSSKTSLGIGLGVVNGAIGVVKVDDGSNTQMKVGDIIVKVQGNPLTLQNAREMFGKMQKSKVGDKITFTIKRGDEEMEFTETLQPRINKHVFTVDPNPGPEQLKLRKAWQKNL
ncbi:MAG TPA: PDZ domain-containing protein [Ignavibacteriaceae bacterium]|nr:PDZ domain-containing protein [Ignavibacteriaceae bacterium]